jgi:hypothetical protein
MFKREGERGRGREGERKWNLLQAEHEKQNASIRKPLYPTHP